MTRPQLIQAALKDVGMDVEIQTTSSLFSDLNGDEWDLSYLTATSERDPDQMAGTFYDRASWTPDGLNWMHYENARVEELTRLGRITTDPEKRAEIYQELFRILNDEQPTLFLWIGDAIYAHTNRLQGFRPNRSGAWSNMSIVFPNIVDLTISGE